MEVAVTVEPGMLAMTGAESIVTSIISEVRALYKMYRSRDKALKSFALFMSNVAHILEGVKGSVPQHAEPVARELAALVATAKSKCAKYADRNACSSIIHLRSEAERLQSIMQGIQQLIPLLTVSVASAANVSAAVADLQSRAASLEASSAEAAAHLGHLGATVTALAASAATSAQIEECMDTLKASQMQLGETNTGLHAVLEGTADLQQQLAAGVDSIVESVDMLQDKFESFSQRMLTMQEEMSGKVDLILRLLSSSCGVAASDAQSMQPGRVWSVIGQVIEAGDEIEVPDSDQPKEWAEAIRQAIASGKLAISSCVVLGVPLMPAGPLRPVTLPCCSFVVSRAGAQQMQAAGKCQVCKAPLAANAQLPWNEAVAAAVQAESNGFEPRVLKREDVIIDASGQNKIGSGGEGTVVKGTLRGGRAVAVKQLPLPAVVGATEAAVMKQVVSASYVAGVASPYVCKLHGSCWTDSELWLVMELCDGSLADLVPRVRQERDIPGLPPVDTIALGLMLCSALDAVHHRARCLHLDITPGNVLLTAPTGSGEAGDEARGVRLSDFGLSKHLPSCVLSSLKTNGPHSIVHGVAKGTPGYASMEQLQRKAQRRSDVYSLGATLLYAATGAHPFGGESRDVIHFQLISGNPMPVPDHVEPAALKDLITSMTAVEAGARPALAEVQQRLQAIYSALLAEGAATCFIAPPGHMPAIKAPGRHTAERKSGLDCSNKTEQKTANVDAPVDSMRSLALQSAPESDAVAYVHTTNSLHTTQPARSSGGHEDVSGIHTVEDLLSRLHAGAPDRVFDFGGRTLRLTSNWKAASDMYAARWENKMTAYAQLSQGGGVVSNVTLAMDVYANAVSLCGSSRVEFHNVTFQGGVLFGAGKHCHVELREATFEDSAVVAEFGATVHLHGGRLQAHRPYANGVDGDVQCSVMDEGTTVHATGTTFDGVIIVCGGAAFTGDRVHVRLGDGDTAGISVAGKGSQVTLKYSDVTAASGVTQASRVGVRAENGAVVNMTRCTVEQLWRGVSVVAGARACLYDCFISAVEDGLLIKGAETAVKAVGCTFRGDTAAVASATDVVTNNVSLDRCNVEGPTHTFESQEQHQAGETEPASAPRQAQAGRGPGGGGGVQSAPESASAEGAQAVDRTPSQQPAQERQQAGNLDGVRQYSGHEDVSGIRSVEDLFARLDTGAPGRTFDFSGRTLHLTSSWKAASDAHCPNWQMPVTTCAQLSIGCGVVSNVTLVLGGADRVIYLRGSSRVEFRNVTVQGGMLWCVGKLCRVVLRDSTFEGCRLSVVRGAAVHLHGGRLHALPPEVAKERYLCEASGEGTTVHATGTTFDGDIGTFRGASFTGEHVHVRLGSEIKFGVWVTGKGSRVTLSGCDVAWASVAPPEGSNGVTAQEAGVVHLTNCTVVAGHRGMEVSGHAYACLRDCRIRAEGNGLWVAGAKATVKAVGCTFRGGSVAIATDVSAGNVSLQNCDVASRREFELTGAGAQTGAVERTGAATGGLKKLARWVRW